MCGRPAAAALVQAAGAAILPVQSALACHPPARPQDPLHYPHGTKFLAPGPLGQCHSIPDSPALKGAMLAAARLHARIFSSYNL